MTELCWIVGSRGLLGGAVARVAAARDGIEAFPGPAVDWTAPSVVVRRQLRDAARAFRARRPEEPHSVVWTAGAAGMGVTEEGMERDREIFGLALDVIGEVLGADTPVILASSVGALHSGSRGVDVIDEETLIAPTSPYGVLTAARERRLEEFADRTGTGVIAARLTNLFGPGQRLGRTQGLISALLRARYSGRPVKIFVPLSTVRDYLYVDDAAQTLLDLIPLTRAGSAPRAKVVGSGRATTVSGVLSTVKFVTKGLPPISFGVERVSGYHATRLAVRSRVLTGLDDRPRLPFPSGVDRTARDVLRAMTTGRTTG